MRKFFQQRWISSMALLCGLFFSLASFSEEPSPPLRFLGNAELPPMVWKRNGKTQGVAVDLVNATAREAGLAITVEGTGWQGAQDELRDGKADALIQINPTPQRLAIYDFSDPLLQSNFHIFRRKQDVLISDIDSLKGRKVGVEAGGFPIDFLRKYDQINVVVVPSWSNAFEKLDTGELDAVFVDRWVGEYELYLHKLNSITLIDPPIVTLESRIAVKKGNTALLEKINEGLRRIDSNGTRQSILNKWQAKEVVYLTRESVDHIILATTAAAAVLLLGVAAYLYRQRKRLQSANVALEASIAERTIAMRQAQEAEIKTSQMAMEQKGILDSSFVGIVKVKDRHILWANPTFLAMFGYTAEEAIDLPTRVLFADAAAYEAFGREMSAAIEKGQTYSTEVVQQRKNGSVGWFSYSVSSLSMEQSIQIAALVDITERRRIVEELHRAFDEVDRLYNDSPIGHHSLGPDGTVLRMNDAHLRWLGYEREEVVNRRRYDEWLTPESRETFDLNFPKFKEIGHIDSLRLDLIRKNGSILPVMVSGMALYDSRHHFQMSNSYAVDLTEQVQLQTQLEEAQHIAKVGSWEVDLGKNSLHWSNEMCRLYGVSQASPPTRQTCHATVHPADRPSMDEHFARALSDHQPMEFTHRVLLEAGQIRYVKVTGNVQTDANGHATKVLGSAQDVTDEVLSRQALTVSEQRYRTLVQSQTEVIIRFSADGKISFVNGIACRLFGVDADTVNGTSWKPIAHPDDVAMIDAKLATLTPTTPVVELEYRVYVAGGLLRWMHLFTAASSMSTDCWWKSNGLGET